MEISCESSSDSDSNSSTSWVFVYDSSTGVQKAINTFHLDCSREPIQELTEQDLLLAGSDNESDTDGISVISESEVPADDPSPTNETTITNSVVEVVEEESVVTDDSSEAISESTVVQNENERVAKFELKKYFKPLNILGVGFVVTAIVLASYNQILTKLQAKETSNLQEEGDVILYSGSDFIAADDSSKKLLDDTRGLSRELNEIVDITISCTYGHKPRNEVKDREIKKCVKKQYKPKAKPSSPEEFSKYKKNMPKKAKFEDIENNYKQTKLKFNKNKNKDRNDALYNADSDNTIHNLKKGKAVKYDESSGKENIDRFKLKHNKYNLKENVRDDRKLEYHSEREGKYKNKIPTQKLHKQKDKMEHRDFDKKYNKIDRKHEFKHSEYKKNKHPANAKTYVNIHKDSKNYKEKDNLNKSSSTPKHRDVKVNSKEQLLFLQEKRQNASTSGEWYTNLHKARNAIRKQEHVSDWVFDRASLRSKKRNKAQWYFKWMNVREQLRYKQSYRPYSS